MRITTITATAVLFLSIAGCSSQTEPTVTPPAVSYPADTPTAAAVKTTDLKLGSVVTIPPTDTAPAVTVAALASKALPNDGYPVYAVQVRLCIGTGATAEPGGYPVDYEPWSLLLDGGESQYTTVTDAGQAPSYPLWQPRTIKPGNCAKGWINFAEVPGKPGSVQYDNGVDQVQASWKL